MVLTASSLVKLQIPVSVAARIRGSMNDLPRSRREAEPSPEPLNLNSEHAPVGQMACPELPHMAPIRALTCSEAHGREGEGASGARGTVLLHSPLLHWPASVPAGRAGDELGEGGGETLAGRQGQRESPRRALAG